MTFEPKKQPSPLPPTARCERCEDSRVTRLPGYAIGAGVGNKPVADDVICQRCGHIGPPMMQIRRK